SCNSLQIGQQCFGAANQIFPRLTAADFRSAQASSYAQSSGTVFDDQPRLISNVIAAQIAADPAQGAATPPADESGVLPRNSLFTIFGQFFEHGLDHIS